MPPHGSQRTLPLAYAASHSSPWAVVTLLSSRTTLPASIVPCVMSPPSLVCLFRCYVGDVGGTQGQPWPPSMQGRRGWRGSIPTWSASASTAEAAEEEEEEWLQGGQQGGREEEEEGGRVYMVALLLLLLQVLPRHPVPPGPLQAARITIHQRPSALGPVLELGVSSVIHWIARCILSGPRWLGS